MSEKKDERAKDQAKGQLASIRKMVAALDRETAAKAYVKGLTKAQIIDLIKDEEGMGCNNDRDEDDLREELTDKITDKTIEPADFEFDEEEEARETAAKAYVKGLNKTQIIDLIKDEDDLREELTDKIIDETIEPADFEFDEEEARERIQEDPLSVQMRSGWCYSKEDMEPEEYTILLCTGGPACRIIGNLDRGEPCSARLEYQDWFTRWEPYCMDQEEENDVIKYARQFWFGE
jgi:hypothetical protein